MTKKPFGRHYGMTFTAASAVILGLLRQPFLGSAFQHSSVSSLDHPRPGILSAAIPTTADEISEEAIIAAPQWTSNSRMNTTDIENLPQNPSKTLEEENPTLASFCHHQRHEYQKLRSKYSTPSTGGNRILYAIYCATLPE